MATSVTANLSEDTYNFASGLVIGNNPKRIQDSIDSLSGVKDELWRQILGLKRLIVGKLGSDDSELLSPFEGQERDDKKDIFYGFKGRLRDRVREALGCLSTFITNITLTLNQLEFIFPDISQAVTDQCLILEHLRSRLPADEVSDEVDTILPDPIEIQGIGDSSDGNTSNALDPPAGGRSDNNSSSDKSKPNGQNPSADASYGDKSPSSDKSQSKSKDLPAGGSDGDRNPKSGKSQSKSKDLPASSSDGDKNPKSDKKKSGKGGYLYKDSVLDSKDPQHYPEFYKIMVKKRRLTSGNCSRQFKAWCIAQVMDITSDSGWRKENKALVGGCLLSLKKRFGLSYKDCKRAFLLFTGDPNVRLPISDNEYNRLDKMLR